MTERTIFMAAVEIDDHAQRGAFLNEACAGDAGLRQQVDSLLAAHQREGEFLDSPALAQLGGVPVSESDIGNTEVVPGPKRDGHADLAFLEPAHRPGMLGRLGHYEIRSVVGRGGMGVVLRAFDEKLQRVVAIKALAAHLAGNGTARQRFVREARAAAAVSDDHVIAIHAVEDAGPVPYLVMQFVSGRTLQDKLDHTGPPPLKEVLRIGLQTAEGLAAAHKQGLIHRDVKPANILLENGVERVRITDFGLARAVDDASLTQSGVIAGTPAYMSPEQAEGRPVDPRSDLFSLGSLLYALCTGHPPFRAGTAVAVLKRVCEASPRPIRDINPEIPDWLEAVIFRLLAKDPGRRFGSAAEVAQVLGQHLAQLQQAGSAPAVERRARFTPPRPSRKVLAAVVATALVVAGAWVLWPGDGGSEAPAPAAPGSPRTNFEQLARIPSPLDGRKRQDLPAGILALAGGGDPALAPAELVALLGDYQFQPQPPGLRNLECSPDGRWLAMVGYQKVMIFDVKTGALYRTIAPQGGHAYRVAFDPERLRLVVTSGPDTNEPVELWDFESGRLLQTFRGHQQGSLGVAFGPDAATVITGGVDLTVRIWDSASGEQKHVLRHGHHVHGVVVSPDGKLLATACNDGQVRVWELATGALKRQLTGHTDKVMSVAFSPDGRHIASGSDRELIVWDAATLAPLRTIPAGGAWVRFAPDGASIHGAAVAYPSGERHVVKRYELATGKQLAELPLLSDSSWACYALSVDGKRLFGGQTDASVRAYDVATGKELFPPRGHSGAVLAIAVSPDGRLLASGGADHTVRLWELGGSKSSRVLGRHAADVSALAFSPNGKLLASTGGDGMLVLWDVARGEEVRTHHRQSRQPAAVAFSPDGLTVAAGSEDGKLLLWETATGKPRPPVQWHTGPVQAVAFSPNGQWLATAGADRNVQVGAATGQLTQTFRIGEGFPRLRFSANSRSLAAASDSPGAVYVWDLERRREATFRSATARIGGMDLHPVGGILAVGDADGSVSFIDCGNTGRRRTTFACAGVGVRQVAFTPEGRYLATANDNGTISLLGVPEIPPSRWPSLPPRLPTADELAKRPSPPDALSRENIPLELMTANSPAEVVAVLGDRRLRHDGPIKALRFVDEDRTLVSCGDDNLVRFWDASNGRLRREVRIATPEFSGCAISPDGCILALGYDQSGLVKLYDLTTGKEVRRLENAADRGVLHPGIAFSPDGKKLATGGRWLWIKLWETDSGKELWKSEPQGCNTFGLNFSPDGRTVVSCNEDAQVLLWDVENGQLRRKITGHEKAAFSAAFSPDGQVLASCSGDTTLRLWDADSGKARATLRGHTASIGTIAMSPDGKTLASGSLDRTVRLWDVATGEQRVLHGHTAPVTGALTFTADSKTLASAGIDGTIRLWDTTTAQERFPRQGHLGRCNAVAVSPDGKMLASAGDDRTIRLWDPATAQPIRTLTGHAAAVQAVVFNPDGKRLASLDATGNLRLWEAAAGKELFSIKRPAPDGRSLAFSPDGRWLAVADVSGAILIREAVAGKLRGRLAGHRGGVAGVHFSPDSRLLVSGGPDGARLWDVESGWQLREIQGPRQGYTAALFHPAGDRVALGTLEPATELRAITTGAVTNRLPAAGQAVAFRADGQGLAACGADIVTLWTLTGEPALQKTLPPLPGLTAMALTPEGRHVVAGHADGAVTVLRLARPSE